MSEKSQTILFLVRHGQTDSGYSQQANIDSQRQLTRSGRRQSVAVGRYLAEFQPTAIYSSPLDRCQEMAEIISQQLDYTVTITLTDKLIETYSPSRTVREGVGDREETIFDMILRHHQGEQIVAVTHQAIISSIVANFREVRYREVPCECADIYRLVFADDILVEATRLQPAQVG